MQFQTNFGAGKRTRRWRRTTPSRDVPDGTGWVDAILAEVGTTDD